MANKTVKMVLQDLPIILIKLISDYLKGDVRNFCRFIGCIRTLYFDYTIRQWMLRMTSIVRFFSYSTHATLYEITKRKNVHNVGYLNVAMRSTIDMLLSYPEEEGMIIDCPQNMVVRCPSLANKQLRLMYKITIEKSTSGSIYIFCQIDGLQRMSDMFNDHEIYKAPATRIGTIIRKKIRFKVYRLRFFSLQYDMWPSRRLMDSYFEALLNRNNYEDQFN